MPWFPIFARGLGQLVSVVLAVAMLISVLVMDAVGRPYPGGPFPMAASFALAGLIAGVCVHFMTKAIERPRADGSAGDAGTFFFFSTGQWRFLAPVLGFLLAGLDLLTRR